VGLDEFAGAGPGQTFRAGGMTISISGQGGVTVNGVRYGSSGVSRPASGVSRPSGISKPASAVVPSSNIPSSTAKKAEVETLGETKIVFYGVSQSHQDIMTRSVESARRALAAKGLVWLMNVSLYVRDDSRWGGTYFGDRDEVWVSPTSSSSLTSIIIHEFGHRFHYRVNRSIWTDIRSKYHWCLKNDSTSFPRQYSRTDDREFWADNFTGWVLGTPLNPYMRTWVGEIISKYNR
jgi:hypothetical protein